MNADYWERQYSVGTWTGAIAVLMFTLVALLLIVLVPMSLLAIKLGFGLLFAMFALVLAGRRLTIQVAGGNLTVSGWRKTWRFPLDEIQRIRIVAPNFQQEHVHRLLGVMVWKLGPTRSFNLMRKSLVQFQFDGETIAVGVRRPKEFAAALGRRPTSREDP